MEIKGVIALITPFNYLTPVHAKFEVDRYSAIILTGPINPDFCNGVLGL